MVESLEVAQGVELLLLKVLVLLKLSLITALTVEVAEVDCNFSVKATNLSMPWSAITVSNSFVRGGIDDMYRDMRSCCFVSWSAPGRAVSIALLIRTTKDLGGSVDSAGCPSMLLRAASCEIPHVRRIAARMSTAEPVTGTCERRRVGIAWINTDLACLSSGLMLFDSRKQSSCKNQASK